MPPSEATRAKYADKVDRDLLEHMSDDESEVDIHVKALDESFNSAILVDNLPVVPEAKREKLMNVVKNKIFAQFGDITPDGMTMPFDDAAGRTLGFAFINYAQVDSARLAVQRADNYQMDAKHVLRVRPYGRLAVAQQASDEFVEPEDEEFTETNNLNGWLDDEQTRDMMVVRYGSETQVSWVDARAGELQLQYGGEREKEAGKVWCELYVAWSPDGGYLATFHGPGVALWAGDDFHRVARFQHRNVRHLEFSPCERYIYTCNYSDDANAIIVWEVATGQKLREFPAKIGENYSLFRWSADGSYIARMGEGVISVFELPSMKLLAKPVPEGHEGKIPRASIRAEGVKEFFWSPTDNILTYWAPEVGNNPARVCLIEVPSRREIRQKNLFKVAGVALNWHPDGHYLAAKVTRLSKSGKSQYTNFEYFRIREDLVPVEQMEMKDAVSAFGWEPKGHRFCIAHGDGVNQTVSFYDMKGGAGPTKGKETELLVDLPGKRCNHLYWSPQGGIIILAGLGDVYSGELEWYDVNQQQTLHQDEHFKCTGIEWDPSGRMVCTSVSQPIEGGYYKFALDNGFTLWTFQGRKVAVEQRENCYQVTWRPRPKSLLSDRDRAKIVKNLKKYERQFEREDARKQRLRDVAKSRTARAHQDVFRAKIAEAKAAVAARRQEHIDLQGGYDSDDDANYETITVRREDFMSQDEELYI